jgi:L-ascorbate metabolism protein UlaG (beta-lactamase superfamily)
VAGVLVGHTHFDHAVDAPAIARRFGCKAYGSDSLLTLMGLHGLAGQTVEVEPYRTYELGPFEVSFTPSVHSKLLLGLAVPYDGDLTCEHLDGLSPNAYRCGQVWGISIRVAGLLFYHQGSANLIDDAIRQRDVGDVDVFLAGVAGRNFTSDYWKRILPLLNPRTVVPTHYDNFFRPLGQRMEFIGNAQISQLPEEIGAISADIEVAALPRADL